MTPAAARRVRVPIGGVISGAVAGLGVLVLLQQSGVLYPTRMAAVAAVLLGALLAFVAVNALAATRRRPAPVGSETAGAVDGGWRATHAVVAAGTAAHEEPDPSSPSVPMDPGLEVVVVQRSGAWAQVRCSNGWTAWVAADDIEDVGARA